MNFLKRGTVELKKCILCNSAFLATSDNLECPKCEKRYFRIKEQIRDYLWGRPSQSASLEQIAQHLGITREVLRAISRDSNFNIINID